MRHERLSRRTPVRMCRKLLPQGARLYCIDSWNLELLLRISGVPSQDLPKSSQF
jgi:hypothetical protein